MITEHGQNKNDGLKSASKLKIGEKLFTTSHHSQVLMLIYRRHNSVVGRPDMEVVLQ
jgi:hypothetical protein